MSEHLPNLDLSLFNGPPDAGRASEHKPRILLLRDRQDVLLDRYSERKEDAEALSLRVNQRGI